MDYKAGFEIGVAMNRTAINKDVEDWGAYTNSFHNCRLTPHAFAVEIWNGYGYATALNGTNRAKKNFKEAWHIAIDFDTEDDASSLDTIASHALAQQFGSFAYSTPSSTPDNPRSRLVFVMTEPITDYKKYETLVKAMIKEFGGADESCKDATRLFFGSKHCKVVGIWSYLPTEAANYIIERYELEAEAAKPQQPQNVITLPQTGDCSRYVAAAVEGELATLRLAASGERHQQLLKSAFAVGGFVGADWSGIDYNQALDLIAGACAGWDNQKEIERVAGGALKAGAAEPRQKPQRTIKVYEV